MSLARLRRADDGRGLHHGSCRRGPHHRSPEASVRGREAAARPRLRAGGPEGGRGEQGIFHGLLITSLCSTSTTNRRPTAAKTAVFTRVFNRTVVIVYFKLKMESFDAPFPQFLFG